MILTSKFYNFAKNDLFKLTRSLTGKTKETLIKIKKNFQNLKFIKLDQVPKFLIGEFQMNGILKMHI